MDKPTKPTIVEIGKIADPRGNLSFIENGPLLTFDIKRVYWIYDVPGDSERWGHAFYTQYEMIIALSGSFDVILDDGEKTDRFHLSRSYLGLLVPPMTWRRMDNFSTNSVALILSSTIYNPKDYIFDYDEFLRMKKIQKDGIQ